LKLRIEDKGRKHSSLLEDLYVIDPVLLTGGPLSAKLSGSPGDPASWSPARGRQVKEGKQATST